MVPNSEEIIVEQHFSETYDNYAFLTFFVWAKDLAILTVKSHSQCQNVHTMTGHWTKKTGKLRKSKEFISFSYRFLRVILPLNLQTTSQKPLPKHLQISSKPSPKYPQLSSKNTPEIFKFPFFRSGADISRESRRHILGQEHDEHIGTGSIVYVRS